MDFHELKAQVISALDIVSEYAELGVTFPANAKENSKGWIACHAYGREDKRPSAAINTNTGVYKDQGGDGLCLSLWDFAAHIGAFTDWRAAFGHYAKKAGLAKRMPKKFDGLNPSEKLDWCSTWNPLTPRGWLAKYRGCSPESLRLLACRQARYPASGREQHYCLVWNVYGPELFDQPPRGFVIQGADGNDILKYQGPEAALKPTKRMVLGKSGLVGSHGLRLIVEGKAELVIKVEGISDLVRMQSAIPDDHVNRVAVITNAAGAGEYDILNEISPVFSGTDTVIIHDHDQPGQTGAKTWVGTVGKYCKTIRNIRLFDGEPDETHGKDLSDWFADGGTFESLMSLIEGTEAFRASEQKPSDLGGLTPNQAILKRLGVVVLGHEKNGVVSIFTERDGLVWEIKDIANMKPEHAIQRLGHDVAMNNINFGLDPDPSLLTMKQVRMAIAAESNSHRIIDSNQIGVGCWELNGRLAVVGAGRAMLWNGGLVETTVPFIEDRLFDFSGTQWFDSQKIKGWLKESFDDPEWSRGVMQEAIDIFSLWDNWRFHDVPIVIAGLICSTWVQTVWPIRPLVAVSGVTNTGKTVFLEAIKRFFGQLAFSCAKPSEAGIRQNIGHTAKVLIVDEFEADWHRAGVLELFRTSTRGQEIVRGDAGQKGRRFGLKHIPWVGAIELGLVEAADQNRFILLELNSRDKDKGSQLVLPGDSQLEELGQKLLVVAMRHWKAALAMLEPLRRESYGAHDLRLVEIYSVPLAMVGAVQGWSIDEVRGVLAQMLDLRCESTEILSSEQELIETIFDTECQVASGVRETVGRMIADLPSNSYEACLERHGIKIAGMGKGGIGENGLYLSHLTVRSRLLRGTKFERMDVKQMLERVRGATGGRTLINGKRPRCIVIPMSAIEEMTGEKRTF